MAGFNPGEHWFLRGIDLSGFFDIEISRTLTVQKVKEISVENVAGSCIKLVYQYEE